MWLSQKMQEHKKILIFLFLLFSVSLVAAASSDEYLNSQCYIYGNCRPVSLSGGSSFSGNFIDLDFSGTTGFSDFIDNTGGAGSGMVDLDITADSGNGSIIDEETLLVTGNGTANTQTYMSGNTLTIEATDTDTTYTAGSNLTLGGTTFSVDMPSVVTYLNSLYATLGSVFSGSWNNLTDVPSGFADGVDNDTIYIDDDSAYYFSLDNFTDTLTDEKLCFYNATTGNLDCSYTDQVGSGDANQTISYVKSNDNISLDGGGGWFLFEDNDTTYSHLSNFTDDLGARGYTHLSNFTNDGVFITNATMNKTVSCSDIIGSPDSDFCTDANDGGTDDQTLTWVNATRTLTIEDGNSVYIPDNDTIYVDDDGAYYFSPDNETDPLWTSNFTAYNNTWSLDTDTNETTRFNNLVNVDCAGGFFVTGTYTNGTVICAEDQAGAGSYDLNISGDTGSGTITDAEVFTITGNGTALVTTYMNGNTLTIEATDTDTIYVDDDSAYYYSLDNFTDTLTDGKLCFYNATTGNLDCSYTDQVGSGDANQTLSYVSSNDNISLNGGGGWFLFEDNDTTYSHLSNFTDDLGARGYTHLSNFTNDGVFITNATMNKTVSCSDIIGSPDSDFCTDDIGGGGGNPFDQSLNTTDNVTFFNLTSTNIKSLDNIRVEHDSNNYLDIYRVNTLASIINSADDLGLRVGGSDKIYLTSTSITLYEDTDINGNVTTNTDFCIDGGNCLSTVGGAGDGFNTTEEMQDAVGSGFTGGIEYNDAGNWFNHSDTSSQASVDNSGNTFIQDITLDTFGHLTAITSSAIDFSNYFTKAEVLGFNYYNSTDFDINDYRLLSNYTFPNQILANGGIRLGGEINANNQDITAVDYLQVNGNVTTAGLVADMFYDYINFLPFNFYSQNDDLILNASSVTGNNYFELSTEGAFINLWGQPGAGNDYKLFTITETQGSTTDMNFYEGGTGHNRFWSSGSVRIGGGEESTCDNLTSTVDCNTGTTGADLVLEDDLWSGGAGYFADNKLNITDAGGVKLSDEINHTNSGVTRVFENGGVETVNATGYFLEF